MGEAAKKKGGLTLDEMNRRTPGGLGFRGLGFRGFRLCAGVPF